jgi:hypothetical protein
MAVTAPIQVCILTVAYRDVFSEVEKPATTVETPATDTDADTNTNTEKSE